MFSNAVLHWVKEPEKAIACVQEALKPGGRFVAEFGGLGNVKAIVSALDAASRAIGLGAWEHPWYYPGVGEYAPLLERAGLEVTDAFLFDRPTPLEGEQGLRTGSRCSAAASWAAYRLPIMRASSGMSKRSPGRRSIATVGGLPITDACVSWHAGPTISRPDPDKGGSG